MAKRKDEILETSIKLFNEKGCINTSTRHIADELGISVGNLYYYFTNKEDILIEIFSSYLELVFKEVNKLNFQNDEIFLFKDFLLRNIDNMVKHKFLHLELNSIIMSFPRFKTIMQEQLDNEIKLLTKLTKHQIKYGYIKTLDEGEINFLVRNSWIIATSNLTFWNLKSEDIVFNSKQGALNMFYLIKPYLTNKSLEHNSIKDILALIKGV